MNGRYGDKVNYNCTELTRCYGGNNNTLYQLGSASLHADRRHADDTVQVGPNPIHEAARQVLRGVNKVRLSTDRVRSNLGGHHVHLVLFSTYHMHRRET